MKRTSPPHWMDDPHSPRIHICGELEGPCTGTRRPSPRRSRPVTACPPDKRLPCALSPLDSRRPRRKGTARHRTARDPSSAPLRSKYSQYRTSSVTHKTTHSPNVTHLQAHPCGHRHSTEKQYIHRPCSRPSRLFRLLQRLFRLPHCQCPQTTGSVAV